MSLISRANNPPKKSRLTTSSQFRATFKSRLVVKKGAFILFLAPNLKKVHRFGATVPAKTGPAVVRNRIKRVLRDVFAKADLGDVAVDVHFSVKPQRGNLIDYKRLANKGLRELAIVALAEGKKLVEQSARSTR